MCASSSEPQKLTPYDEFTVFGLPSNHGQYEEETVWDCMRRNDGPPVPRKEMIVQPPKKLMREIEELEAKLAAIQGSKKGRKRKADGAPLVVDSVEIIAEGEDR